MKTLDEQAEEYAANKYRKEDYSAVGYTILFMDAIRHYKAGAQSDYVKQEIVKAKIEVLDELSTDLIKKIEHLKTMSFEYENARDVNNYVRLRNKIEGAQIATENIRRSINKLQKQLEK